VTSALDAVVVGSGPNGLAAAITLAQRGLAVRVYEAQPEAGGGLRSAALTQPGFLHDVCATVHALTAVSPFLRTLPLDRHGFALVHPGAPFAHPLDDGTAIVVERSIDATAAALPAADGRAYRALFEPFVARAPRLMEAILDPLAFRHPFLLARFGLQALRSSAAIINGRFADRRTRAMLAGVAAHAIVPLEARGTAGYLFGLVVSAHAAGWPFALGGSQRLATALGAHLGSLGGDIVTGAPIASLGQLPAARATMLDITPRQFVRLAQARMPAPYRRRLERYRYGPAVFKIDWALSAPVPWRAEGCRRAGTLHLGGSFEEIAESERAAWHGRVHERPYVLVTQPSLFDARRAPAGRHTLWAYCHVPHGCGIDMTERIENQIERFAPGFRDCILARHVMGPAAMEARNANLVGGDIAGGAGDFAQLLMRPIVSASPYVTAIDDVYLCSSSTPPGVGLHGMCGHNAARAALGRTFR